LLSIAVVTTTLVPGILVENMVTMVHLRRLQINRHPGSWK